MINSLLTEVLEKTVFLAKSLDDFTALMDVYKLPNVICSHSSSLAAKKNESIFVHENEIGTRRHSTSQFFERDIFTYPQLVKKLKTSQNVWSYQAYPWTNDLKFMGKAVYAIDYFLFLKLSNKFSQLDFLSNAQSPELRRFFRRRYELVQTYYNFANDELRFSKGVYCKSYSNGGDGVFVNDGPLKNGTGIYRVEKFIPHKYSLNQIAIVLDCGTFCYSPSQQILSKDLTFLGSTFELSTLPQSKLLEITKLTTLIGQELSKLGYRGMFGCDYLLTNDDEIVFIELNPRYQASSFILNQNVNGENVSVSPHIMHINAFHSDITPNLSSSLLEYPLTTNKTSYIKLPCMPTCSDLNASYFVTDNEVEAGANKVVALSSFEVIMKLAEIYYN